MDEDTVDDFDEGNEPYADPFSVLNNDAVAEEANIQANDNYNHVSLMIASFQKALNESNTRHTEKDDALLQDVRRGDGHALQRGAPLPGVRRSVHVVFRWTRTR